MRLPASSPAAVRQERLDRLRRDRTAALPLRVAFPAVEHLLLALQFESETRNVPAAQSHLLHPPARAFFEFPCPFADCDGQFDLTTVVNAMLTAHAHQAKGVLECAGQRPHPYTLRTPCRLHLVYSVVATYRRDDG